MCNAGGTETIAELEPKTWSAIAKGAEGNRAGRNSQRSLGNGCLNLATWSSNALVEVTASSAFVRSDTWRGKAQVKCRQVASRRLQRNGEAGVHGTADEHRETVTTGGTGLTSRFMLRRESMQAGHGCAAAALTPWLK